ncbi:condensation domain-containing protein, partial [Paracidovorax valerianellae]|uniref:condensation domain-containing protein n=1 Tax=Paracidovorax valerianellae TaxID=187868 RepID=UPI002303D2A9
MPETQDLSARRAGLTPEQRAQLQQRLRGAAQAVASAVPLPQAIVGRSAPGRTALSAAQQRMWFLWQLDPTSTAYHVSGGLRLDGAVNQAALVASLHALVERHESLRTVFAEAADGSAEQCVQPAGRMDLPSLDLRGMPPDAQEARRSDAVQKLRGTPFDLSTGPLMRVLLIQRDELAYELLVVMHHIISDGWSVQVILDELAVQYAARVRGQVPVLQPLPIQYTDYSAWQAQWLASGEGDRQLAWWRAKLGQEQPALSLPTDRPRRGDGRYRAAQHRMVLPESLVLTLRRAAQGKGATLFMALLSGFHALLHRYTGQADVRVGVPVANRNRTETVGVVGFFVNTQVLRARLDGRLDGAALLEQTRDTAIGAQTHQELPFEHLVAAMRPERSLSTSPLFQVMFNHLRRDHRSLADWPGVTVGRLDFDEEAAQFELTLQTCETGAGQVEAAFIYAAELFEAQTMERMAGHYIALLQALAEHPEQLVGEVPLLGQAEQG